MIMDKKDTYSTKNRKGLLEVHVHTACYFLPTIHMQYTFTPRPYSLLGREGETKEFPSVKAKNEVFCLLCHHLGSLDRLGLLHNPHRCFGTVQVIQVHSDGGDGGGGEFHSSCYKLLRVHIQQNVEQVCVQYVLGRA